MTVSPPPPPLAALLTAPPSERAVLFCSVTVLSVSVPRFSMAPPVPVVDWLLARVLLLMLTVALLLMNMAPPTPKLVPRPLPF